jgi:hypothetical protein
MPGTVTTSPTLLERTGTGRRHACHCTSYGPPLTAPSSRPMGSARAANLYATTLEAAPVRAQDAPQRPNWRKLRQDGRKLCGIARHASTRRRIVRHSCKLLPPWPIKGEAVPQPRDRRTTDSNHAHAFRLNHDIGTCLINTSRSWRPGHLSRHACSPPLRAPWCNAI